MYRTITPTGGNPTNGQSPPIMSGDGKVVCTLISGYNIYFMVRHEFVQRSWVTSYFELFNLSSVFNGYVYPIALSYDGTMLVTRDFNATSFRVFSYSKINGIDSYTQVGSTMNIVVQSNFNMVDYNSDGSDKTIKFAKI